VDKTYKVEDNSMCDLTVSESYRVILLWFEVTCFHGSGSLFCLWW